ncbi:phosphoglycolate phosphatase-like HAD superfamily hydrolase [Nonomuraea polychroma]|uniref:Phosphoglycolate phosphatase-like HAD superfamily hydrolase n=1 Tax=Nonomuraea polychroma TaxID=46176 RepID=A0A438MPX9_9ACTN|nr:HAD hydrolase-like protein [Nonomuraea polychroma]RVX47511.1 phosphoglycolate phosphatase-like HAD superfamily hydrolase [Nonomuraea polychroma]
MTKHIIWDWNGTLFHDIDAVVGATNEVFKPYALPVLTADGFRAVYTRPIWLAYERLLGRPLAEGEWELLDDGFHEHYYRLSDTCALAADAELVLTGWTGTQSLCSMAPHAHLVPKVDSFGISGHFTRIDGLLGTTGGEKAAHMTAHIQAIGVDPGEILVIGDSVDDGLAAKHVGAKAVLYTGGMTTRADLESTGLPVVDTLADALDYA